MSARTTAVLLDVQDTIARLAVGVRADRLLDVGCWDGSTTMRYAQACGAKRVFGVEYFPGPAESARSRGIDVSELDLERGRLPHGSGTIDLVICNQVFEHLKNVFGVLGEIHRVLVVGGSFIVSMPNLASLHNRVLLALGAQPTSIRILGPHVRGFSYLHTKRFLTLNDLFEVTSERGCGFYPFSIGMGRWLARAFKSGAHTMVFHLTKTSHTGESWSEHIARHGFQTVFLENEALIEPVGTGRLSQANASTNQNTGSAKAW